MDVLPFIGLMFAAGISGAVFKPGDWYAGLEKPSWTPPDWAFPVVWTILYAMIAAAGWLVWRTGGWSGALVFWGAQLVLNAAWSWLFFGRRRMDLAFVDVCLLGASIVGFIVLAAGIDLIAAALFTPYLAWVTTAALLNLAVWRRNPAA